METPINYSDQPTPYVEGIGHDNSIFVCHIDVVSRDRVNGTRYERLIACYSLDEERIKEFVDRKNKRNDDLHDLFNKNRQAAASLLLQWQRGNHRMRMSYDEMQVDICNRLEIPEPLREAFTNAFLHQTEWLTKERYSYRSVRTLANYDIDWSAPQNAHLLAQDK